MSNQSLSPEQVVAYYAANPYPGSHAPGTNMSGFDFNPKSVPPHNDPNYVEPYVRRISIEIGHGQSVPEMLTHSVTQDMPMSYFKHKLRLLPQDTLMTVSGVTKEDTPHIEPIVMSLWIGKTPPAFDYAFVGQIWYDTVSGDVKVRREDALDWTVCSRYYALWNHTLPKDLAP